MSSSRGIYERRHEATILTWEDDEKTAVKKDAESAKFAGILIFWNGQRALRPRDPPSKEILSSINI